MHVRKVMYVTGECYYSLVETISTQFNFRQCSVRRQRRLRSPRRRFPNERLRTYNVLRNCGNSVYNLRYHRTLLPRALDSASEDDDTEDVGNRLTRWGKIKRFFNISVMMTLGIMLYYFGHLIFGYSIITDMFIFSFITYLYISNKIRFGNLYWLLFGLSIAPLIIRLYYFSIAVYENQRYYTSWMYGKWTHWFDDL